MAEIRINNQTGRPITVTSQHGPQTVPAGDSKTVSVSELEVTFVGDADDNDWYPNQNRARPNDRPLPPNPNGPAEGRAVPQGNGAQPANAQQTQPSDKPNPGYNAAQAPGKAAEANDGSAKSEKNRANSDQTSQAR